MNFLEELYYGNINPNEKCFARESQYAAFIKIIAENQEKLTAYFNAIPHTQKERHLFFQLMNAQEEVLQFSEENRFIEGFQLGARCMLDTFIVPGESVIRDIL